MARPSFSLLRTTKSDAFVNGALQNPHGRARVRKYIAAALHTPSCSSHIASLQQIHGTRIQKISRVSGGESLVKGDALIAQDAGIALIVRTADCVPVTFYDTKTGVFGVAHAGWRGTRSHIARLLIERARDSYGVSPHDCSLTLGPAIHVCCYSVSPQRARAFTERFGSSVVQYRNRKPYLDLIQCNAKQLVAIGVPRSRIQVDPLCTACSGSPRYYSYRRGDTMHTNLTILTRTQ